MSLIEIEWLYDDHHCETCGSSYTCGARVAIDGVVAVLLEPVANCFGGDNWHDVEVYRAILAYLGHEVRTDIDEPPLVDNEDLD